MTSPPSEAIEFRGKTLTPVSPKPLHYPSPSNIPILEKQMDPVFNDTATHTGVASTYDPNMAQQNYQPNDQSAMNAMYFQDAKQTQSQNGTADSAAGGVGNGGYNPSQAYGGFQGADAQNQDTSSTMESSSTSRPPPADTSNEGASSNAQTTYDSTAQPPSHGASAQGYYNQAIATQIDFNAASQPQRTNDNDASGVDIQALLDTITSQTVTPASAQSGAPSNPPSTQPYTFPSGNHQSPISALPGNPNLPPRPPPQEKPEIHPNYAPGQDIRSYHQIAQPPKQAAGRGQPPTLPPLMTNNGPPGVTPTGMPPPPAALYNQPPLSAISQRTHSPATPGYRQRDSIDHRASREPPDDSDIPWGPDIQALYDQFLQDERVYVTEGQWDKFPPNSRLFIGNLPTEKVTKRDLFHLFYKHGKLAQISIKQAYGFVQFLDAGSCARALQAEQGQPIRGRKMHLEISKPQRNTRNADGSKINDRSSARRRSRSPDYTRGGIGGSSGRGDRDRYAVSSSGMSPRGWELRGGRDGYRPGRRSQSPGYRGGRRDRSRDRYDGRRRSRSRSPYGRSRYRSPSPRDPDDGLPLPRRDPRDVPDVQVIAVDPLDQQFIGWVEKAFTNRGVRVDVLLLSPRLNESDVIRRQILEGVQAVCRLTRRTQDTGKIPLQVYNRSRGADNVDFQDYENLDPSQAADVVVYAKQTNAVPNPVPSAIPYGMPPAPGYTVPPTYASGPPAPIAPHAAPQYNGYPPAVPPAHYPPPQHYNQPPPPMPHAPPPSATVSVAPDLSNLITSLDPSGLQKLLGAMQQPSPSTPHNQGPPPAAQHAGISPNLARLISQGPSQQAHSATQAPNPYGQSPQQYGQSQGQPDLNAILAAANSGRGAPLTPQSATFPPSQPAPYQAQPPAVSTGQPDMNEIMAQLAKYQR